MKKLFSFLIAAAIVATPLSLLQANAEAPQDLSARGSVAVKQLAACIQTAESLDVYYVIDNSSSLTDTDPSAMRAGIIAEDVERWADMASLRQGLQIRINGTFFAGATSDFKSGWQSLTLSNKTSVSAAIGKEVRSHPLQNYTNWLAALNKANVEMGKSQADCKTVVWFTDGGLWIGEGHSGNAAALSALCGVKVPTTGVLPNVASDQGLIQQIRSKNVSIFGVLLNSSAGNSAAQAEEAYWRSYMRILVEEEGSSVKQFGKLPAGEFKCGPVAVGEDLDYSSGAYLEAASPSAVAYPFMLISSQVAGGNLFEIGENGNFWIDPAFKSFEILTLSETWKITDAAGKIVKSSKEPHAAASTGRMKVSLTEPEEWNFDGDGALVLYPELSPVLDPKTVFIGEAASISGHFVDAGSGNRADLSQYSNASLLARIGGEQQNASFNKKTGVFAFEVGEIQTQELAFGFDLTLETEHYKNVGPLSFSITESAKNPKIYPSVAPITFSKPLASGKDTITASILVRGPEAQEAQSGQVCFAEPSIVADDQNEVGAYESREDSWEATFNGLDGSGCVTVARGSEASVSLSISNPSPKNATVTGVEKYSLASDAEGATAVEDSKQFKFETGKQIDLAKAILIFIVAYLLSVGIPLIGLYFMNRSAAKIQHGNEVLRASFPVEVNTELKTMTAIQGKNLSSGEIGMDEFQYRPPKDPALSFEDSELGTLRAVVPFFPLISPWYEVVAKDGQVVVTGRRPNRSKEDRYANGSRAIFDGHLGKLWTLTIPASSLIASSAEKPNVNGRLVVFGKTNKGKTPNFPELMANAIAQFSNSNALAVAKKALIAEAQKPAKPPKGGSDSGGIKVPSGPKGPTPPAVSVPSLPTFGGPPTTSMPPAPGAPIMPPPLPGTNGPGSPLLPPPPTNF